MPTLVRASLPQQDVIVDPEWQERTLIFRFDSGGVHAEDGWWYGTLAVHASLPGEPDLVVVTHTSTRLAILRLKEVEDAIAAAEILWRECRGAWRYADDVDITKIPPHMIDWITRCNEAQKILPL
jgi:hypothetical protein